MKVAFVGPSVWGGDFERGDVQVRGPAATGDILRAVRDGATAIGLIDGVFGGPAAVWHKEILFALAKGVTVYGASSMGALRAAELHIFGMRAVGLIARAYLAGELDDDGDVAMITGPAEFDYMPLSEPLVDVLATVRNLLMRKWISTQDANRIEQSARAIFFQVRGIDDIVNGAIALGGPADLSVVYRKGQVYQKRADALELLRELKRPSSEVSSGAHPTFTESAFWSLIEGPANA